MKTRLVLLGPPACGKGTQAALIEQRFGIEATSTGQILRAEAQKGTERGLEADRLTRNGGFVPDEMVIGLVRDWLCSERNGFIFDGFPRTLSQGLALDELLLDRPLQVAFYLNVADSEIRRRVMARVSCRGCEASFQIGNQVGSLASDCPVCGGLLYRRKDDEAGVIETRLREYRLKTAPLIPYYQEKGILIEVDGSMEVPAIFSVISKEIERA